MSIEQQQSGSAMSEMNSLAPQPWTGPINQGSTLEPGPAPQSGTPSGPTFRSGEPLLNESQRQAIDAMQPGPDVVVITAAQAAQIAVVHANLTGVLKAAGIVP